MKTIIPVLILLLSACASTQSVQDTAELASQQLLRLETDLQAASRFLQVRYQRQLEFTEQNLNAAVESENYTNQIRRVWEVSGNAEANRLYSTVLSTRPEDIMLPSVISSKRLSVRTSALKKAIKDLGSVSDSLSDQESAKAFIQFGHAVQKDYKKPVDSDEQ